MKLANIIVDGTEQFAIEVNGGIVPISILSEMTGIEFPKSTDGVIADQTLLEKLKTTLLENEERCSIVAIPKHLVQFAPCVKNPGKIICIGLNYRPHVTETNMELPTEPIVFGKYANTLTGHRETIQIPSNSEKVDYEAELCIVIGKQTKDVMKEQALDYVFGYCIGNDVSARDLQFRSHQWLLGKNCDQFAPVGPYLVTTDEIENPNSLNIRTFVNGEKRQDSNTETMIFSCETLIEDLSKHMTLEPGDIIMTGTPEGVVLGFPEDKQIWLKSGDVVTIEIDGLGQLINHLE
ncbi:fumarylacetoacetate hydrolase family protein [Alkalihalobacillus deserti]|uniref:fumarylacetoacetate hydrolase family protein n=1 Tax=Alkalihalobacillus deserti TaxID=2879466 RepID=UPI001D153656|nr:fumarylacetoacetate hydrolase family protein [Alkalihalobacillus deserti]